VSVCLPTRNGAELLPATLRAVAAQTLPDWELIVAVNASTDACAPIAAAWAEHDPRIRVVLTDDPLTEAAHRNLAVAEAAAPVVKLLDPGAVLHPHCLHRQLGHLCDPWIALAVCRHNTVAADGRVLAGGRGLRGLGHRITVARAAVRRGDNPLGPPAGALFRRADYLAVGGCRDDPAAVAELDLWLRLLGRGELYASPATLLDVPAPTAGPDAALQAARDRYLAAVADDPTLAVRDRDRAVGVLGAPLARARAARLHRRAARALGAGRAELEQNRPAA